MNNQVSDSGSGESLNLSMDFKDLSDNMKNQKYHTVRTVSKSKIVETEGESIPEHAYRLSFVFWLVYWCPTQYPFQMTFVWLNSNRMSVTHGAGIATPSGTHEFSPVCCGPVVLDL